MPSDHEEHLIERLARVVPIRTRRMFGGVGIYAGEHFFALIASDVLYLKVDERNRADFEARGMGAFQPFPDRPAKLLYYELPADVLDDPRRLRPWVEKALAAARDKAGRAPRRARPKTKSAARERGAKLRNLGPVSMRWLAEVGVRTRADLERRGSVATFRAVKARGLSSSLNLLYALEGALLDLRWDRLPEAVKRNLRERAGLER